MLFLPFRFFFRFFLSFVSIFVVVVVVVVVLPEEDHYESGAASRTTNIDLWFFSFPFLFLFFFFIFEGAAGGD